LANSLGLILERQKKFISYLSEIRNLLVHKVSNVNFSFENYVNKLDKNQKKNFVVVHSLGLNPQKLPSKGIRETFVIKKPKLSIWLNGIYCLDEIYYCIQTSNCKKKAEELKTKKTEYYKELLDNILVQLISDI